ncbi:MAG: SWIM zinc finger family protein [Crocinitomicaceae bacterium]|nr:SWIM zinc finger family protein [Crocinitomicaceae bacterium]
MKIPLDQFELHVDETILQRGLSYFKKDTVQDVTRYAEGRVQATVLGTNDYKVVLDMDDEYIHDHRCNCPYDMGPICKHVVAVMFFTQQENLDISIAVPKKKKRVSKPKTDPVKEIMDQVGLSELRDFLISECKSHKDFETRFITSFSDYVSTSSRSFYQKQIRAILKKSAGREKFIFRSGARMVTNSLEPLLQNTELALELDQDMKCFQIGSALLEETIKGLQFIDDSNGYYGDMIQSTAILLDRLSHKPLEESVRKEFLKYCIKSLDLKIYEGWDWHMETLYMAVNLVDTKSEAKKITGYTEDLGEYQVGRGIMINFQLLEQFGSEKEIQLYIADNMSCDLMREYCIESAIEEQNFEQAIELCREGLDLEGTKSFFQKRGWYDWLLRIAQERGDKESVINYARGLFLNNNYLDQEYYSILKSTIASGNWTEFVDELIDEIKGIDEWSRNSLLHKVLVEEEYWDQLLELVMTNPSLDNLKENEQYLAFQYSDKYISLYAQGVNDYLDTQTGRPSYRQACRFLQRMKKLGGKAKVMEMIDDLRIKFPQRRALLEELDKV